MILEPFKYYSPDTLEKALELLKDLGESAKVLAGGQSLIPIMKMGIEIEHIIDIKKIKGLSFIREDRSEDGEITGIDTGALVRYCELERSDILNRHLPLLPQAASGIGHPLVRNRGTIGGSLSHADPAADLCTVAVAMDAAVTLASAGGGERKVPVQKFLQGPLMTDMREGEILTSVSFPAPPGKTGYDVQKLTLGHGDFPVLVAATSITIRDGRYGSVAIALGGVGDTPVRAEKAERILEGSNEISDEQLYEAAMAAEEEFGPPDSAELSPEYTKSMISVYVRRALRNALERIGD